MGDPSKIIIYRPTITNHGDETSVTYRYNKKYETADFRTDEYGWSYSRVAVDFAQGFREYAFKNKDVNKGSITRKDALKIIQNIFIKNTNVDLQSSRNGRGGALSEAKHIFDIYTDRDSDGGEMITQKEQSEIMHLYASKYGTLKKED